MSSFVWLRPHHLYIKVSFNWIGGFCAFTLIKKWNCYGQLQLQFCFSARPVLMQNADTSLKAEKWNRGGWTNYQGFHMFINFCWPKSHCLSPLLIWRLRSRYYPKGLVIFATFTVLCYVYEIKKNTICISWILSSTPCFRSHWCILCTNLPSFLNALGCLVSVMQFQISVSIIFTALQI